MFDIAVLSHLPSPKLPTPANLADCLVAIRKQLSTALPILESREGQQSVNVQSVRWWLNAEECRNLPVETQYVLGASMTYYVEDATAPIYGMWRHDGDGDILCSNPEGHKFTCTGTAYGGDDESYHGEGRCLCEYCGADGDA